jgi:hypothetical protein
MKLPAEPLPADLLGESGDALEQRKHPQKAHLKPFTALAAQHSRLLRFGGLSTDSNTNTRWKFPIKACLGTENQNAPKKESAK